MFINNAWTTDRIIFHPESNVICSSGAITMNWQTFQISLVFNDFTSESNTVQHDSWFFKYLLSLDWYFSLTSPISLKNLTVSNLKVDSSITYLDSLDWSFSLISTILWMLSLLEFEVKWTKLTYLISCYTKCGIK